MADFQIVVFCCCFLSTRWPFYFTVKFETVQYKEPTVKADIRDQP